MTDPSASSAGWDDQDQPDPPTPAAGPFAMGPVDPLLYSSDDSSPELRAAAAYVPVSPRLQIRDARPVPPGGRTYEPWTPGPAPSKATRAVKGGKHGLIRALLYTVLAVTPLLVGWFLVSYGLHFLNN